MGWCYRGYSSTLLPLFQHAPPTRVHPRVNPWNSKPIIHRRKRRSGKPFLSILYCIIPGGIPALPSLLAERGGSEDVGGGGGGGRGDEKEKRDLNMQCRRGSDSDGDGKALREMREMREMPMPMLCWCPGEERLSVRFALATTATRSWGRGKGRGRGSSG